MVTDKSLLLSAILGNIKVEGDVENGIRSQYYVRLYVADKKVAKSTNSKPTSSVLEWEWHADNQIWFEPSSIMKVVVYRGFGTTTDLLSDLVVQHEGKVVDFLENNTRFDLTDKRGNPVPAKMKILLSRISGSDDNIEEFMKKVDAYVSRLSSNDAVSSTVSTLGQVLQVTKKVMDNLAQLHPILNASWTVVSSLYQAVQEMDIQDESIRELATTLRELLGTANRIPNLLVIQNTTSVIEDISRQSLHVASLIHEYTKLSRAVRTVKIQGGLKSSIEECRDSCAALMAKLSLRINVDTNTRVQKIEAGLHEIVGIGRTLDVIKDGQREEKINKWLSPPDSSRNRNEANKKHQKNTCSWFLDGERFLEWQANPGFLWIKGKSGSGKSILCSSILNKLPEGQPTFGVAYFFFDGRDSQNALQLHEKLIRSLISQFSNQLGGIPGELDSLYNRFGDHQQPSSDQLEDVLHNILGGFSHAYIVIDALDECIDHKETLIWVNKLVLETGLTAENTHMLVTSRPERDIEKVFWTFDPHAIDIGESTANQDIIKYLKHEMESKFNEYSKITREKIESEMREHAEGSFCWVALQLAELEKCFSEHEIMQQLKNLPEDLDDIYKRILKALDRKYHADTMTFLQWLAFSRRPMEIAEIAEAITVDFDLKDGPIYNSTKQYRDARNVLARCSSLVSESGGIIKLSHFSVKEYLLSTRVEDNFRINEIASHSKISEICVAYLLQFDSFEPMTKAMLVSSPLALYAAQHWVGHAKSGGMGSVVQKLILQLFISETACLINWIRMWNIDFEPISSWEMQNLQMNKAEVHSPLYYASLAGMEQVAYYLLQKGAEVNAQGGTFGNALQAASYQGYKSIVKLLLEKGADVNAQGGEYGNALQAALSQGYEAIVKLLIEQGADVNAQGRQYVNERGGVYVIHVDGRQRVYGNALHAASSQGHKAIVELLLEKGAEVNAQGGTFGNALQAALFQGYEAIVKLLLEKGADVNAQGGEYGNALQAASSQGRAAIVKILLEKGAEVNAEGRYGSALWVASSRGHEEVVKILLEKGAEVNTQGRYGSPLQAASLRGHEAIIKVLLKEGADVNAQGGEYGNALQAASSQGYEAIVNLLLENGVNVNAEGGEYGNALQAASSQGHEAIVKVLLKNKAEVNVQGVKYGPTGLHSKQHHLEVMQQL